ncbi:SPOR domain-containing protein [Pararhizobium sp. BT-229]|uniref:SPOR domain-containing protein n=1 Tax=Pararhizobium sp. BT-229 TaxID=2986923 RepID=UPI0021F7723F|nr:SPOR domain-containing protein [Pararhizobium sp. BT-229]MCV9965275.1 SPOR domain-containing protein [Pararhizobium sp. BT-229]
MADKQLARSGTADFNVLADDDPLAELARIVGYDNRPAIQQLQELERHREAVRREPVLNLEDELLREFDAYDAPPVGPAVDAPDASVEAAAFAPPVHEEQSPVEFVEPELIAPEAEAPVFEPSQDAEPPVAESEPVFVEEHSPTSDEAISSHMSEQPIVEPLSDQMAPDSGNGWAVEPWDEPVFDGVDLERELELSIGYDETTVAPENEAHSVEQQIQRFEPELSAEVDVPQQFLADAVVQSAIEEPVTFEAAEDFQAEFEQPAAAVLPDGQAQDELPEWQPEPVQAAVPSSGQNSGDVVISPADPHGIDALLADIERFPVPAKAPVKATTQADVARKVNYPFTPTFSRATPVASNSGVLSQKAFATPLPAATVPVVAAVTETAYQPAETPVEPVVVEAAPVLKTAVEQEADFDLETFELDLSGIDLDIDPSEFDTVAQEAALAPAREPVAEPVAVAAVAPAYEVQEMEEPVAEEPESVLPFDPSMIAETEESVTAITDLNVPQLPVVEQERPPVQQPDYDLDIDAEMAQLFGTPSRGGRGAERSADAELGFGTVAQASAAAAVSGGARVEDDFDEFEKAMEEDFRLSLSQRQEADPSADRLAVGSGYAANNDYDEEGSGSGKRRLVLLAAAVAGLAIFGGVGVYAFMGNGSALSGGEPKIILADKSPVKVVPVEKGGKTVPNQDKAVYDRVAGAQDATPQQGALVSSTEEPVDVVQRTLTPEDMPLEGAGDELPGVAPADDDGSDRLLPDDQTAENAAAGENDSPAVSPRKVRTMIVKPDGTLVAREEPQPETNVASTENAANQGDPQVKTVKTTAITSPTETGSTPKSVPVADQAVAQQQKSALAEAADATVDETAPVRSVKTTAVADNPVPQTRPVEEQAKVVDTFKTTDQAQPVAEAKPVVEAKPAAEAKPVETASIAPGTYVIQIASLPSEAEARKSYNTLSSKFGSVIGGKGVDIKKAEIAGKGTYFRVRIPAGSREEANALCSRYKSAGGSCLVTK